MAEGRTEAKKQVMLEAIVKQYMEASDQVIAGFGKMGGLSSK